MDVLVSHRVPGFGQVLAHLLAQDPRVTRCDFASSHDQMLAALLSHQYDLHLVGFPLVLLCCQLIRRIKEDDLRIFLPKKRVLFGDSPNALSVAQGIWAGFDGVIDVTHIEGPSVDRLIEPPNVPIEHLKLSATGSPIAAVCHDETDLQILMGIVEGRTDPEIAETLHYAVQTIRNRVSRILTESGADNRTHLVSMFLVSGGVSD